MKLIINGEDRSYDDETTLAAVVATLKANPERVATLLNDNIVKQGQRATAVLNEGDRVEVLSFAGGG